jgi:pyrroline-5-carboxylate reductase
VTEAGVKSGLSRSDAVEMAIQTMLGTATLLSSGCRGESQEDGHFARGTTAAGLKVFEERDLTGIVADALKAAQVRADELGRRT